MNVSASVAARRVATRDASSFDRPDTRTAKRYHAHRGDWIGACTGNPLDEASWHDAGTVPEYQRCQRAACRKAWPR